MLIMKFLRKSVHAGNLTGGDLGALEASGLFKVFGWGEVIQLAHEGRNLCA
jgi:hypothetical protein